MKTTFFMQDPQTADIYKAEGILDRANVYNIVQDHVVILDDVDHYQARLKSSDNRFSHIFVPVSWFNR